MRFVIVGAGAVGGVIGGRLFQHGHEVALVARGEHGRVLAARGLTLEDPDGEVTLAVPAVSHPSDLDWRADDVAIVATKTQQALVALDDVRAAVGDLDIPVVCATNGLAAEDLALRWFARVIAMCVFLPATHLHPGVVQASAAPNSGVLDVGRYPHGADGVTAELAEALSASCLPSVVDDDVMAAKRTKLLGNLGNIVDAVCGPAGRSPAAVEGLLRPAREEALACYRAAGLRWMSETDEAERRKNLSPLREVNGRPRGGGSTWQSLARGGGSVETDYLNGEIMLLGRLHGVATPVNAGLQHLGHFAARTGVAPGSMTVADALEFVLRFIR